MKLALLLFTLGAAANFTLYMAILPTPPHLTPQYWAAGLACYTPAILTALRRPKR